MVGTSPYLRKYYPDNWDIFERSKVGIPISEGLKLVENISLSSMDVIFVSLGTNNFYTQFDYFVKSINEIRRKAGPEVAIIWATIVRPLQNEYTYMTNPYLRWNNYMRTRRDHRFAVADWYALVEEDASLLEDDLIHANKKGYSLRARLYYDAASKLGIRP